MKTLVRAVLHLEDLNLLEVAETTIQVHDTMHQVEVQHLAVLLHVVAAEEAQLQHQDHVLDNIYEKNIFS